MSPLLLIYSWSMLLTSAFVGVNIGTKISELPSPSNIVSILQSQKIKHIRLFDPDHQMLTALANTGIEVMVGVPNSQLLQVEESRTAAADWINKNVAAFVPATNITYIAVGDEVLTTIPNAALVLIPAIQFLQSAILAVNLNFQVKISSPQSMDMIPKPFPPSTAMFNSTWNSIMLQLLQSLKKTGSSFMLNAQPYYGYTKGQGVFPIDYALFKSITPNDQIVDPNTLFHYSNMFDAMIDAAYYSMKALNFSSIPILVTATGWPWLGGDTESDATIDNALAYNSNLIRRVLNDSGPPGQSDSPVSVYIRELFNEDLLPEPLSERNWGMFSLNGSSTYSLSFGEEVEVSADTSGLTGLFCVANSNADPSALKKGLDWACGPGSANCAMIQPGQSCYVSGNLVALASYAYNNYYHRTQASGGTCSFGNTASIVNTDLSFGSCVFSGSSRSGSNTSRSGGILVPGPAFAPTSFPNSGFSNELSGLDVLKHAYLFPLVLHFWLN